MRKFVLLVKYGTGKAAMIVDTPDLIKAVMEFKHRHMKGVPDTKEYGMPEILKAEIIPVMYDSVYEKELELKEEKEEE